VSRRRGTRLASFSLVEVLVVLAVIVTATSMIFAYNKRSDQRRLQVRFDAEQLASVLRRTRAMAMENKSVYGVAFNITNARGSSGRVLNNRDGGHYYRIIGPSQNNGQQDFQGTGSGYNVPYRANRDRIWAWWQHDFPWSWVVGEWSVDWVGPKVPLTRGQVRFLALADQDNGNMRDYRWSFGKTYPRPWFGEWDPATKRMYAWGGYDPEILDFDQRSDTGDPPYWQAHTGQAGPVSFTGFYYEGADGRITGSANPADRFLLDDNNGVSYIDLGDPTATPPVPPDQKTYPVYKKGETRPLVNADWLDAVILFYPDGSACYDDWFRLRHHYAKNSRDVPPTTVWWGHLFNDTYSHNLTDLAPVDRCNEINTGDLWNPYNICYEASHYVDRTGYWYITLAPDSADDRVSFPTAQQALGSISPMWRVGVNRLGEVKVVEVKRYLQPGVVLDDQHADAWWESGQIGTGEFYNNLLQTSDGAAMPVEDRVTPEMLAHRMWWIKLPPKATGP
jgi:hypothetical protein